MNALELLLRHPTILLLGWALVHFLWQGSVIAVLLALALRLPGLRPAANRYAVACLALLLMTACPVATMVVSIGGGVEVNLCPGRSPTRPGIRDKPVRTVGEPPQPPNNGGSAMRTGSRFTVTAPLAPPIIGGLGGLPQSWLALGRDAKPLRGGQWGERSTASPARALARRVQPLLPALVLLWLCGVLFLSLRLLGGWAIVRRLGRRNARPVEGQLLGRLADLARRLGVDRPVRLLESGSVAVPMVMGCFRSVILVPVGALSGLPPQHLEALLAHELAHVRRHDTLVNLLQTAAETLLFYHPAVWWVSACIRREREHCCDDLAVSVVGDRLVYARALAGMEALRSGAPSLALAATDGPLLARVRRVLGLPSPPAPAASPWLGGTMMLALLLAAVTTLQVAAADRQPAAPRKDPPAVVVSKDRIAAPTQAELQRLRDELQLTRARLQQLQLQERRSRARSEELARRSMEERRRAETSLRLLRERTILEARRAQEEQRRMVQRALQQRAMLEARNAEQARQQAVRQRQLAEVRAREARQAVLAAVLAAERARLQAEEAAAAATTASRKERKGNEGTSVDERTRQAILRAERRVAQAQELHRQALQRAEAQAVQAREMERQAVFQQRAADALRAVEVRRARLDQQRAEALRALQAQQADLHRRAAIEADRRALLRARQAQVLVAERTRQVAVQQERRSQSERTRALAAEIAAQRRALELELTALNARSEAQRATGNNDAATQRATESLRQQLHATRARQSALEQRLSRLHTPRRLLVPSPEVPNLGRASRLARAGNRPASARDGGAAGAANAVVKGVPGPQISNVTVLDLRGVPGDQVRRIESVEDVTVVLLDPRNRAAFRPGSMREVHSTLVVDADARVIVEPVIELSKAALEAMSNRQKLVLVGIIVFKPDVTPALVAEKLASLNVAGVVLATEAVRGALLGRMQSTGISVTLPEDAGPVVPSVGQTRITTGYLERLQDRSIYVNVGATVIAPEVTEELLARKIRAYVNVGETDGPKPLLDLLQSRSLVNVGAFGENDNKDEGGR